MNYLKYIICWLFGHEDESHILHDTVINVWGDVSRTYICGRCDKWDAELIGSSEYQAWLDIQSFNKVFKDLTGK